MNACGGPQVRQAAAEAAAAPPPGCPRCADDAELRQAVEWPAQLEFVRRLNAIETALTGRPLTGGNRVELLRDGPATHAAQLRAIAAARNHVHLITYILSDDEVSREYLAALSERSKAGVKVRLMFDSVGSRTVGQQYRDALSAAGIEVNEFGPLNPAKDEGVSLSRRHHRKILVVDGKVAFTGGINITDEQRASSSAGSRGKASDWRDTHIRIEGPAVAEFQKLFIESWQHGQRRLTASTRYWPDLPRKGNDFVRAVTQQGNDLTDIATQPIADLVPDLKGREPGKDKDPPEHAIYASYLAAITNARSRIWITQAYFIPNRELLEVLTDAAERGVDVRVLVPGTSDIGLMVHASRFHYAALLEAGARLYEYQPPVLHAKTAVVDSVWATVGSSNLDFRSFIHNDEANAIIVGSAFGRKMEEMFVDDLTQAREITLEDWRQRSWLDRARQRIAVLLKYWI